VLYHRGTMLLVATKLRLLPAAEEALRAEAQRTGRSQQDLIRSAVDRYLHLSGESAPRTEADALVEARLVLPARSTFRQADNLIRLSSGVSSLELLDREDRL